LAHLVEQLMRQGSRNLGPGDAARLVTERGGILDSATDGDLSQFCSELPSTDLALASWIEADRMKNLSATPEAFARQRDLLLTQQAARASSELHSAGLRRLTQLAYQDYAPYQDAVFGDGNDLPNLTLQQARDFHWHYHTPSNAVVSIVADLDPSQALELATEYFSSATNRFTVAARLAPRSPSPQSTERLTVQTDANCLTPGVFYGYRLPRVGSEDQRIARVIAAILAGSSAARLPTSLITERGSALRTQVWLQGNEAADLLVIYATVAPLSSVDKAQEVVEAELKRLRFFGPTAKEVENAKIALQNELLQRSESPLQVAKWVGRREALGASFDLSHELAAFETLTPDQIQRVAQLYLTEHKRSIVEVYPPGWPQDEAPLVVILKHTVKRGENLEAIARRYGSSVSEIARVSSVDSKRPIQPGQVLKVPVVGGKVPAAPAAMRSHKVRAGDSLSLIAKIYGTTVTEIVQLNSLDRSKPIVVGQKLTIPPKRASERAAPSAPASKTPATKSAPKSAAKPAAKPAVKPAPKLTPKK
jgi:zinc protease